MRSTFLSRAVRSTALLVVFILAPTVASAQEDAALPPAAAAELTLQQAIGLDTRILTASLRPLKRDEVGAELETWLGFLEQKCRALSELEIEGLREKDPEAIAATSKATVELEGQRGQLMKRVEVVLDSFERKGGDPQEARAYIDSVVVAPQVAGWHAAWVRVRAWIVSPEGGIALGLRLLAAVGMFLAAWLAGRALAAVVSRTLQRLHRTSELLRSFIHGAVRNTMIAIGVVLALAQLGIEMSPMIAAIGAAGLVVGLALQGTLSNFASGLLIMVYRPFDVGDVVSVAGVTGKIKNMTLVSTALTTFDNQRIYLPNNSVWNDVITNVTESDTRRVDLVFGVAYEDDMAEVQRVLEEVVGACDKVLAEPEPVIRVHQLADSSVNFIVRPWVRTADYWDVYWELTRTVKQRFDEEGITIPFPQRTLHVVSSAAGDGRDVLYPAPPPAQGAQPADAAREQAPAGKDA